MHIVVADPLSSSALDVLRLPGWTIDLRPGRTAADLARDLSDADALVVRSATQVTADLLSSAPRLRLVARAGTGVDNVDVTAASARGIVVMNAPGANSISVAEHAIGLMLALARSVPAADAAMKKGVWDKKRLTGVELRGKILGVVGLGRIGREVAARARAFGMDVVAHDPFIPARAAADVVLVPLDDLLSRADYVTLHVPSTPATHHLLDAAHLACCKRGVRIVNTARGELIDEGALADAIASGVVAGAGLDVFETEPPADRRLVDLPQVIATPHISASTIEAQEQVGQEIAACVRDYLRDGIIRNAVNFPAIPADAFARVRPFLALADRLGALAAQLLRGRPESLGVRYYGPVPTAHEDVLGSAVIAGALRVVTAGVTVVNARATALTRGLEVVESRSSRQREFANVLSVKLRDSAGERWVEGTVFEDGSPRLHTLQGVPVEAPLSGTLLVIDNDDQPGVIGDVGTALGRHGVNIANFALGRGASGAVGVINVDAAAGLEAAVDDIRGLSSIRDARVARL